MQKISSISIERKTREGYPGKIIYANVLIDGIPLTDYKEIGESDFVNCVHRTGENWYDIQYCIY